MLNDAPRPEADQDESDVVSHSIGEYGRWQFYLTFLLSLVNIPCTWHIFVPTFQDARREFWCARPAQFGHVPPALWTNYTQPRGPCLTFNLSHLDEGAEPWEIRDAHGARLVRCEEWEFEEGGGSTFAAVCGAPAGRWRWQTLSSRGGVACLGRES